MKLREEKTATYFEILIVLGRVNNVQKLILFSLIVQQSFVDTTCLKALPKYFCGLKFIMTLCMYLRTTIYLSIFSREAC